MSVNEDFDGDIDHHLKTEEELFEEYQRLRQHLQVFWMYRPLNKSLRSAYPNTVRELDRRVNFLEDILQIPNHQQFNYEEYDQVEVK